MDAQVRHPEVVVELVGENGNAFVILGKVRGALRRAEGVTREEVEEFMAEATNGSYDHLLQTCMQWVTVN